jgi:hypothetical protein
LVNMTITIYTIQTTAEEARQTAVNGSLQTRLPLSKWFDCGDDLGVILQNGLVDSHQSGILLAQARAYFLDEFINLVVFYPAQDDDQIVFGVNVDEVCAVADVGVGGGRCVWVEFLVSVEEVVHKAVGRLSGGGSFGLFDEFGGEDLFVAPFAVAGGEQTEASHISCRNKHSAAPVSAAADGLNCRAVQHNPRIFVAVPTPSAGRADFVHHVFFQDLRQRLAPDVERGEGEDVDADIVVFVNRARFIAFAVEPVVRVSVRAVCPIGFAPECAFPIARLSQKMFPSDFAVVFSFKEFDERRLAKSFRVIELFALSVNADGRRVIAHRVLQTFNQLAVKRQPDDRGDKTFRNAKAHINAPRVAPFGNYVTAAQDDAGLVAALFERADCFAKRLAPESLIVREFEIARGFRFALDSKINRFFQPRRVHLRGFRRAPLPSVALRRIINRLSKTVGGEYKN